MAELHETRMGKTLIDSTLPKIAKELKRIADVLELRNMTDALLRAKQEEETTYSDDQLKRIADILVSISHDVGY